MEKTPSAQPTSIKTPLGDFELHLAAQWDSPQLREALNRLPQALDQAERVSRGADTVWRWAPGLKGLPESLAVKSYRRQSLFKDTWDRYRGSPALRAFRAARFLCEQGVGTPAPLAVLELWQQGPIKTARLKQSYYLCAYENADSLREQLRWVYTQNPDNQAMLDLLGVLALAVADMHEAGFRHGDMGNQNILLPHKADGSWDQPQFIDLNRACIKPRLSIRDRARDLARLTLPGEYRRIFLYLYSRDREPPPELVRAEARARARFRRHQLSRPWRHPLQGLNKLLRGQPLLEPSVYPRDKDLWIWDERSAQAMILLSRREKNRYRSKAYLARMLWQCLAIAPAVYKSYRALRAQSFNEPRAMTQRVGVALHPKPDYRGAELALLEELDWPPVLVRFCHHETSADWKEGIALIEELSQRGLPVMAAFVQDRRALLHPESWHDFLESVIPRIAHRVEDIEIGHAINRTKWGVWTDKEYRELLTPALNLQHRYPQIRLTGPACIDFEYHYLPALLQQIPASQPLSALSHHLYVDRRGQPENPQGGFSTLEKCALLRAIARAAPGCEERVIISEVNWPLKGTGTWSPIGAGYETPEAKREPPGVTETDYANYLVRYQAIALCSGHVERVFWWRLSAHGYGLVDDRDGFRQRAPYRALQVFLQTLGQARFKRRRPTPEGCYELEFETDRQRILLAWRHGGEGDYWPAFKSSGCFDVLGEPVSDTNANLKQTPVYLCAPR